MVAYASVSALLMQPSGKQVDRTVDFHGHGANGCHVRAWGANRPGAIMAEQRSAEPAITGIAEAIDGGGALPACGNGPQIRSGLMHEEGGADPRQG